ncbi:Domain of unknown function DUF547 [Ostreococcus tauri]|uniref:DEP domain-containing protein n=1 Tax=Ostreococcus tauri TaxID=70448 RepID=A0A096PAC9_OSTTA|nr:Domain of unknown function DUF547 [Ostreococcus tauri]CEG01687.1 Domain of unknown function DUF547 [Ostreococcus tauri]|eukprot:XP_022841103.1 Domain of unknown function DUF547 [Ostreococcus tauri]
MATRGVACGVRVASTRRRTTARARARMMIDTSQQSTKNQIITRSSVDGASNDAPRVCVVGTTSCPHCKRAKAALEAKNIAYEEISVDGDGDLRAVSSALAGFRSVPQVYVGGVIYGGADDTCDGLKSGEFERLVREAEIEARGGAPGKLRDAADARTAGRELPEPVPPAPAARSSWLTQLVKESETSSSGKTSAKEVANEMAKEDGGVTRSTRRRFGGLSSGPFGLVKTHVGTFTPREAVDWMIANKKAETTEDAVRLGEEMVLERLIQDVDAAAPFVLDGDALFRFRSEAPSLGCAPLNCAKLYVGESRDAKSVVEDVRNRILKLYDEFLSADGRAVDYAGLRASAGFKDFVESSEELQRVNLNALSREERIAFFINVYNALVIHATCVFGAPKNTIERLDFFSKASYDIGGSTYTCDDIENGILRGNRPGAATIGALTGRPSLSRGPFRAGDPRRNHVVIPMDPRIHFALVCGARSCPPIRVYTAADIERELEDATYAFFESEIDIKRGEDGEVASAAVSKIVGEWYKFDFGSTDVERLKYASKYMKSGDDRDALIRALERSNATNVKLTTRAYDWTLNDGK